MQAADVSLTLSGGQEVPPVNTTARGSGTVKVNEDGTVSGSVNTTGIQATAAHIHSGASGKNGPVVIALSKGSNGNWMVPANAKLTPDQLKLFKSGELYVNVHSAAHPDGEIRAQLK
ncbi:MAG: CHRD domain-containing protein [Casimicrobiaceae bacterium]